VLLRTRPEKGLLGGMTEVPTTDFTLECKPADHTRSAPLAANWQKHPVPVEHVFTHFRLALTVYAASVPLETAAPHGMRWTERAHLQHEALPTLFRKVLAHPPK
jgi:A/G-specific adenine glycosylase